MNKRLFTRAAQTLALLAVIAVPLKKSEAGPSACYRTCLNETQPVQCGDVPPESLAQCSAYVQEVCRCQCYPGSEYCI